MDVDSSGNIVAGGNSLDSTINGGSSTTLPLVVFFKPDGTIKWANHYAISSLMTGTNTIYAIKFVGTSYVAMGYRGPDLLL
jgi:hypothetical protein